MADASKFSPDAGSTIYDLKDTNGRIMSEQLIRDTVGWTGKNKAYSQTNNAVIASIESGITYKVSWSGSATITLKKNSSSGTTITSGSTSPLTFTADSNYDLYFGSSASVTNIMVYDATISDSTYEPYHDNVSTEITDVYKVMGENGAKNLLISNATSQTINTLPFVVNTDKSIYINGTPTARTVLFLFTKEVNYSIPAGQYILSKGVSSDVGIVLDAYNGDTWVKNIGTSAQNDEVLVTIDFSGYDRLVCYVVVNANLQVDNLTIKPMLRNSLDIDSTYHKSVETNSQLTDMVTPVDITSSFFGTMPENVSLKTDESYIYKIGKIIIGNVIINKSTGFDSTNVLIPIVAAYQPKKTINSYCFMQPSQWTTDGIYGYMYISNYFNIRLLGTTSDTVKFAKCKFVYVTA